MSLGVLSGLVGCSRSEVAPAPALSLWIAPPTGLTPRRAAVTADPPRCHVSGTIAQAYRDDSGVALRATRGGAPFADMTFVTGEHVGLTLFDGADDARLDAEVEHVSFTAWTERDAFLYEPADRFAIDGYFAPYAEEKPLWSYGGADQFRTELPVPAGLRRVDGGSVLRATRSCEEMTVVSAWSEDRSLFGAAPVARIALGSYEAVDLPVGASVALSAAPGGPPVAFLEPTEPMTLQVRDAPEGMASPSADLAYVAWDTHAALVFGWVARASLGPIQGGGGYGRCGGCCGMRFGVAEAPRHFRQCQAEIPLFVRAAETGEPSAVGTLGRDALFRVDGADPADAGFTGAAPQMAGFSMSLRDHAAFLVRTADLDACPDVVIEG